MAIPRHIKQYIQDYLQSGNLGGNDDVQAKSVTAKKIGNNTVYSSRYSTLQDAIDDAPTGGEVVVPESIDVGTTVTLDESHNGITVKGTSFQDRDDHRVINSTITDGSNVIEVDGTNSAIVNISFIGVRVSGSGSDGDGIHYKPGGHYRGMFMQGVSVEGVGGDGFYFTQNYQSEYYGIFADSNTNGIVVDQDTDEVTTRGLHFVRPWSANNSADGILETTDKGYQHINIWDHPVCPTNGQDGMHMTGMSYVRHPHMENNSRHGINVDGDLFPQGNDNGIVYIYGGDIAGSNHQYGIRFRNCIGGGVDKTAIEDTTSDQILLDSSDDVQIGTPITWERDDHFGTYFYSITEQNAPKRIRTVGETQAVANVNTITNPSVAGRKIINNASGSGSRATFDNGILQHWNGTYYRTKHPVSGSYTGQGTTGESIELGFRPARVLVVGSDNTLYEVTDGSVPIRSDATSPSGELSIANDGFVVGDNGSDADPNTNNESYNFKAE